MLYVVNHTEQKLDLPKDRKEIKVGRLLTYYCKDLKIYKCSYTGAS